MIELYANNAVVYLSDGGPCLLCSVLWIRMMKNGLHQTEQSLFVRHVQCTTPHVSCYKGNHADVIAPELKVKP